MSINPKKHRPSGRIWKMKLMKLKSGIAAAMFIADRIDRPMPSGAEHIIAPNGEDVTLETIILRISNNIVDYQDGHAEAMDHLREALAYAKRVYEPELFESFCGSTDPEADAVLKEALKALG